MTTLPPEHQSRLDRELDKGEQINWVAQPSYQLMRKQIRTVWFWLLLAVGFFVFFFAIMAWVASMTPPRERQDEPWTFFVAIGVVVLIWLASYPLLMMGVRSMARNTIYALTNKRAIIIRVHRDGSITERDYRGDELIHLARKEYKDGSGTLTFESARGAGHSSQTASRHKFAAIERVIEVERMLRDQFGDC